MTSRPVTALFLRCSKTPHLRSICTFRPHISASLPQRSLLQIRSQKLYYRTTAPRTTKPYTFSTLQPLILSPSPSRIIIDVREPAELQETGRIPGAKSMPITSNPEAIFLPAEEFEDKFGFEKPGTSVTGEDTVNEKWKDSQNEKEVIFYCKAGVRSRAAARMAAMEGGWENVRIGDLSGGWLEWEKNGGRIER